MAYGLRETRHYKGGEVRFADGLSIAPATAAIYTGDMVKIASGLVEPAVATDTPVGVFKGCSYKAANGEIVYSNYWPGAVTGATEIVANVISDANVAFSIENSAALAQTDVGATAAWVPGTGDPVTGQSGGTVGATTGSDLKIIGRVQRFGNDWAASGTDVEVLLAAPLF